MQTRICTYKISTLSSILWFRYIYIDMPGEYADSNLYKISTLSSILWFRYIYIDMPGEYADSNLNKISTLSSILWFRYIYIFILICLVNMQTAICTRYLLCPASFGLGTIEYFTNSYHNV